MAPLVKYAVKGPKTFIWASCNRLPQKLGFAAKDTLILCFVQLRHQRLVLRAIFSAEINWEQFA
jgi:hypothetical protein